MSQPPAAGGGEVLPWTIVGLFVGVESLLGLLWVAEGLAGLVSGHGWNPPPFRWGVGPVREVLADEPTAPRLLVLVLAGVLLALAVVVVMRAASLVRRRQRARHRLASALDVNARADIDGMTARERAAETTRLHPKMTSGLGSGRRRALDAVDLRDVLGTLIPAGPDLYSGWEDVELAFMAPRSGKTTARAIPRLIAAPGAAIGTANKADLYQGTWKARAALGRVWRFDPQQITHAERTFWVNLLGGVRDDETARQLAAQFTQVIAPNGGDPFWANAAGDLLSALLLAAAVSEHTLGDVWRWLNAPTDDYAVGLLEQAGLGPVAESVRNAVFLHPETRDSVFQTARTGASCLRNPRVLSWVTPQQGLPEFNMDEFVASTDTIYLMSKDTAGAAAPLLAGILDQCFDAAQARAERHGGRLPIPVTAVLDEVGNIAPWDRLPKAVSFSGSLGFAITAILQNWAQGKKVWGETGMEMLFGGSTIKLFGAGIDDDALAKRIALFVGQHEVRQHSATRSAAGRSYTENPPQLRDVLPPDAVRAMPKGSALVMATGRRPAMVRLRPYYRADYKDLVDESIAEARAELAQRFGWPAG